MVTRPIDTLPALYQADETAWLEAMAELIRERRYEELDYANLYEYLTGMAIRDRREVERRPVTLIAHVLNWKHQPQTDEELAWHHRGAAAGTGAVDGSRRSTQSRESRAFRGLSGRR